MLTPCQTVSPWFCYYSTQINRAGPDKVLTDHFCLAVHMEHKVGKTVRWNIVNSLCLLNKLEQVSVKSSGFLCSARHDQALCVRLEKSTITTMSVSNKNTIVFENKKCIKREQTKVLQITLMKRREREALTRLLFVFMNDVSVCLGLFYSTLLCNVACETLYNNNHFRAYDTCIHCANLFFFSPLKLEMEKCSGWFQRENWSRSSDLPYAKMRLNHWKWVKITLCQFQGDIAKIIYLKIWLFQN